MFEKGKVLGKGKGKTEGEKGQGKGQGKGRGKKDSLLPPECVPFLPPEPADATLPPNAQTGHSGEALGSGAGAAAASTETIRHVDGPAAGTAAGAAANGGPGTADGAPNTTPNKMHGAAAPKRRRRGQPDASGS